jgi:hypothetical protein
MAQSPGEIGQDAGRLADPSTKTTASAPTSDEIRSQIEHTRAEMSHTIDAIQARLSPGRLVTDAKQTVRDATVGRVKRLAEKAEHVVRNSGGAPWTTEQVLRVVKSNIVPVAFVGVTAVAAAIRAFVRSRNRVDRSYGRSTHVTERNSSRGVGPHKTRLLAGVCVGLGCWSAWRASSLAREETLVDDLAQPM